MQIIIRKENKWFMMDEKLLDAPGVCDSILWEEEDCADAERPLAELVIRGWDLEAVA